MIPLLLAQAAAPQLNGGGLALAAAIVAIVRRKHAIGGWLLYFFLQSLLGLGLLLTTTHWRRYLSTDWDDPALYFVHTLSNLSRLILLTAITAMTLALFRTREWNWVAGVRLALAAYAFITMVKLAVDIAYFPETARKDTISLAFPSVWIVYFLVSRRVHRVFKEKTW